MLIIQSHGGVAPIVEAARLAAGAVLSGPAGGVAGSRYAAKLLGQGNLIPFDMGGTSTDICLIVDGEATLAFDRKVGNHRVALNSLDIVSLGAGGGSIGRVDAGGILHVGPESAGAYPGPACYGRGGTLATVTDANLVLGYLDPKHFLGGRATLDLAAAEKALDQLAGQFGVDAPRGGRGHPSRRQHQHGGGHPHRLGAARRRSPALRAALLRRRRRASRHRRRAPARSRPRWWCRASPRCCRPGACSRPICASRWRAPISATQGTSTAPRRSRLFDEMAEEASQRLRASFDGPMRLQRSVDMRYGEQIFEINVPLDDMDWTVADPLPQIVERFHRRHEELYTYALRDQDSVLVNARVVAVGLLPDLPQEPSLPASPPKQPSGERRVYIGDWTTVPVYDFDTLAPAQAIAGPAIVESAMTTVLLRPKDHATLTPHGWLDISVPVRDG